jgi:uncharacterized repeat protein (TIGR01451 family)
MHPSMMKLHLLTTGGVILLLLFTLCAPAPAAAEEAPATTPEPGTRYQNLPPREPPDDSPDDPGSRPPPRPGDNPGSAPPSRPGDDSGGGGGGGGGGGSSRRPADPAIYKQAGSEVNTRVGETFEFAYTVTNVGEEVAEDVQVRNTLPSFLELVEVRTTWGEVMTGNNAFTIAFGDIYPDNTIEVVLVARVNGFAVPPTNFNTAILSSSSSKDKIYNNMATFVVWTR